MSLIDYADMFLVRLCKAVRAVNQGILKKPQAAGQYKVGFKTLLKYTGSTKVKSVHSQRTNPKELLSEQDELILLEQCRKRANQGQAMSKQELMRKALVNTVHTSYLDMHSPGLLQRTKHVRMMDNIRVSHGRLWVSYLLSDIVCLGYFYLVLINFAF